MLGRRCLVSRDIVTDGKGNLIVPDTGTRSRIYFAGPHMRGPKVAQVEDLYGQPTYAAHVKGDALTQQIAVANLYNNDVHTGG